MIEINKDELQENLSQYFNHDIYVHFEMTNGAYAAYRHGKAASGFVRNAKAKLIEGKVTGDSPFRVGLKTSDGWLYADGLTHSDHTFTEALLMYGFDDDGKMQIALQLSTTPFE
ncbi:DUF1806 family protein [Geomicrobium sp. JCM 19055]|uniref:DUF1806 family protein n=1 Tax=Geomicrobium sp. JCM 19055 TaxID=1460649 RepID=UPI00045ECF21|nr:DUF1806 family protein [Geomicrobium sp. JCM 19055]GAK01163.1 hypothetical protein JCM19055_4312 [Geomicrobium sp. JCM 19055]